MSFSFFIIHHVLAGRLPYPCTVGTERCLGRHHVTVVTKDTVDLLRGPDSTNKLALKPNKHPPKRRNPEASHFSMSQRAAAGVSLVLDSWEDGSVCVLAPAASSRKWQSNYSPVRLNLQPAAVPAVDVCLFYGGNRSSWM